ncbi:MAG: Si-specific NAD(P)(+) transhydrogenase [Myxococcales bacterium]|nr:MAG: Si-specific NAD(P)(+) transhydrogenase [Myxococcales bacterium]
MSDYDLVVIGGGPAGQKAAVQGAKAGARVLLIERAKSAGGACVRYGTIPSKTLRETALSLGKFRKLTAHVMDVEMPAHLQVSSLMERKEEVVSAHERYMEAQLSRNGIELQQGVARFVSPERVEITLLDGSKRQVTSRYVVIAAGSSPRTPDNVPVDHEHILDSDSLLSLSYLPQSLVVLGAGVIACEYASIFAALGVQVTIVDKGERPLGFMDQELVEHFLTELRQAGGDFLGKRSLQNVVYDGLSSVETRLEGGEVLRSEKLFCALGRVAPVAGLGLEAAGVKVTPRGLIQVDANLRTTAPNIYAAGDVIGPPALASTSMEQGRRAACHALGLGLGQQGDLAPAGIYTIPELGSVGLTEQQVRERYGDALVGRAKFEEVARGQISAAENGLLKLVVHPQTGIVLGAHAAGESATELVHIGQMAIIAGLGFETFIDTVFNFPTFAEAYRVAAFDLLKQQRARSAKPVAAE